ncbi:Gti1/Pac2 family-domain-containing protein [Geopyxis carbonaria]|nr:Gti1/Pac2 family-domain-containing protein [Geopyxis carbonaria]
MSSPIAATMQGIVLSSRDALLLFSECIQGHIPMITRRPHDKERATSIVSGNIFIYCENNSSIKRWTDGVTWSPSRIMGNFLIYRELNKGFPPGEKKRAAKKRRPEDGADANTAPLPDLNMTKEQERSLIGSLLDSYDFKLEGLVKKTISVKHGGNTFHLVSYYTPRHAATGFLTTPSNMPQFKDLDILPELLTNQNFRIPVNQDGTDTTGTPPPQLSQSPVLSTSQPMYSSSPEDDESERHSRHGHPGYMQHSMPQSNSYDQRFDRVPQLSGGYDDPDQMPRYSSSSANHNFVPTSRPEHGTGLGIFNSQMAHPRTANISPPAYPNHATEFNSFPPNHIMSGQHHSLQEYGARTPYASGPFVGGGTTDPSSYASTQLLTNRGHMPPMTSLPPDPASRSQYPLNMPAPEQIEEARRNPNDSNHLQFDHHNHDWKGF